MAKIRPEIAVNMLLKNIVGDPSIVPYVFSKLVADGMPVGGPAELLRLIRSSARGPMSQGELHQVLQSSSDQSLAQRLAYNALFEPRESIDRYIASINEHADLQILRGATASMSLDLSGEAPDVSSIKRKFVSSMASSLSVRGGVKDIGIPAEAASHKIERAFNGDVDGTSVGYGSDLDELLWFAPKEVTTVAGSPGSGKTAFVAGSAMSSATAARPHMFFSLEMASDKIALRMACANAGVPYTLAVRGRITVEEKESVKRHLSLLAGRGIFIDDSANNVTDMYYKVMTMDDKPSVVWIDYSELVMTDDLGGRNSRNDLVMAEMFKSARRLAIELEVHLVFLWQLSRDSDKSKDKWPTMRDLAQSSYAEKGSDNICLLMRPQYYIDRGQKCRLLLASDATDTCYGIIAKSKNGSAGVCRLGFDQELMRFYQHPGVGIIDTAIVGGDEDDD